ncbi:hypothetical protein LTR86_005372 [Recurvomyces mirabilis]|nr:hypothetical protein LTR86_005372 [Recurvomyces mirabilis]
MAPGTGNLTMAPSSLGVDNTASGPASGSFGLAPTLPHRTSHQTSSMPRSENDASLTVNTNGLNATTSADNDASRTAQSDPTRPTLINPPTVPASSSSPPTPLDQPVPEPTTGFASSADGIYLPRMQEHEDLEARLMNSLRQEGI